MTRITVDLLRRRAEHNEGCLADLEEITLHQQDIEKIEVIGDCCRKLKILYLCNNYIGVIEGVCHLKWLTYLNLAVNNITAISGLSGCESLERLDLTLNFIADLTSVQQLEANPALSELHLTGNPCTKLASYRGYVVHTLPQLSELDGSEVTRAERIHARQEQAHMEAEVRAAAAQTRAECAARAQMRANGVEPFPARYNEQGERVYGHTPEERMQMLRDQEQKKQQEEQQRREAEGQPGSLTALRKAMDAKPVRLTAEEEMVKYGRLLMRNEAKLPFTLDDETRAHEVVVTVDVGKFISTSLIDVQVDVHCVRVTVKEKLLQLPVEAELAASLAQVQRSSTTGQLKITIPTVSSTSSLTSHRNSRSSAQANTSTSVSTGTAAAAADRHPHSAAKDVERKRSDGVVETIAERVEERRLYRDVNVKNSKSDDADKRHSSNNDAVCLESKPERDCASANTLCSID